MRQNKDVSKCNSVGIVIHKVISKVWIVLKVWMVLWIELWISWEMRERVRELYPDKNADFVIAF